MIKNSSDKDENNFGFADNNCGIEEISPTSKKISPASKKITPTSEKITSISKKITSEFGAKRCKTSYKWYIIDGMAFKKSKKNLLKTRH